MADCGLFNIGTDWYELASWKYYKVFIIGWSFTIQKWIMSLCQKIFSNCKHYNGKITINASQKCLLVFDKLYNNMILVVSSSS